MLLVVGTDRYLNVSKFSQGLTACDANGVIGTTSLPKYIKPLGPYTSDATTIQSLATALHVSSQPITGITRVQITKL